MREQSASFAVQVWKPGRGNGNGSSNCDKSPPSIFISSGKLLRRDVGGPRSCARYQQGERGVSDAAVALHVSWAGRTLWAHDASHASIAASVPIMGPGATVGPVGTRVPTDLSALGPVRTGANNPPSPRRERLGRPRGEEPPRAAKCTESPGRPVEPPTPGETSSSSGESTPIPHEALPAS